MRKRRFELVDGKSSKFWEIHVEASATTTRWGRIGANGQTKSETADDGAAALASAEKKIAGKLKKGYSEVSSEPEAPATRRFELVDDKSSKFWEIQVEGAEITTCWGRIGSKGRTKSETAADAVAAQKSANTQIGAKLKKGYSEVGSSAGSAVESSKTESQDDLAAGRALWIWIEQIMADRGLIGLASGATPEQIATAERTLGVTFPSDFRNAYLVHNGEDPGPDYNLHPDQNPLLSLDEMVAEWLMQQNMVEDFLEMEGEGWWSSSWIPIVGHSGFYTCLDLDSQSERHGQVIEWDHEVGPRGVIAPDYPAFLDHFAVALLAGRSDDDFDDDDFDDDDF